MTRTYYDNFSLLYLNTDKAVKNLSPGKVACIWRIERFQIDAIKCEEDTGSVFSDVFAAAVVVNEIKFTKKRDAQKQSQE